MDDPGVRLDRDMPLPERQDDRPIGIDEPRCQTAICPIRCAEKGVRQTLVVDWASLAADLPGRLTEDLRLSKQRAVRSLLGGKLLGTTD